MNLKQYDILKINQSSRYWKILNVNNLISQRKISYSVSKESRIQFPIKKCKTLPIVAEVLHDVEASAKKYDFRISTDMKSDRSLFSQFENKIKTSFF